MAWESCRKEAVHRKEGLDGWLDEDLQIGFNNWLWMSASERLLLMATYAPDYSSADVSVHMADRWRLTGAKKIKKKVFGANDWQVVGKKQEAADDDSDSEDEEPFPNPLKAPYNDLDDMTELEEAEAAFEKLNRDLDDDDDDDDWSTPVHSSNRRQTDLDVVTDIVNRDVNIFIDPTLQSKVLAHVNVDITSLSKKERSKLASCWSKLLGLDAAADVSKYTKDYRKAAVIDEEYHALLDSLVLSSAAAIGMTTNGAAKYNTYVLLLPHDNIIFFPILTHLFFNPSISCILIVE
jgi:hypothetical protein